MFQKQEEVKSFVSGLRGELKKFPSTSIGHNQLLEIVARAAGHESYGHLLVAIKAAKPGSAIDVGIKDPETGKVLSAQDLDYRLFNTNGDLDLAATGLMMSGLSLIPMRGTVEDILDCSAFVSSVNRAAGKVAIDYEGSTDVNWDRQVTRRNDRGARIWETENNNQVPEDGCFLVPEGFSEYDDEDFYDEDRCLSFEVPVRQVLVDQVARYVRKYAGNYTSQALGELHDRASDDFARDVGLSARALLGRAQTAVGFRLHALELEALAKLLAA